MALAASILTKVFRIFERNSPEFGYTTVKTKKACKLQAFFVFVPRAGVEPA